MRRNEIQLSIIIVNYKTEEELFHCLRSIEQSNIIVSYEIILIDNGSDIERLNKITNGFHIRCVHNKSNLGFAKAVNQGIRHCSGEYILVLNPDTEVEYNTIQTLIQFMKDKRDAGCVAPTLVYQDGKIQPSARSFPTIPKVLCGRQSLLTKLFPNNPVTRSYLLVDLDRERPQKVEWVMGACLMTKRSVIEKVGPFDERFFLFLEDVDFCYRLREHGYGVYVIPDARVMHKSGSAMNKNWQRSLFSHNVSMLRFFEKHYNPNIFLRYFLFLCLALRIIFLITIRTIVRN